MDTGVEVCIHLTQCAAVGHLPGFCVIGEKGAAAFHEHGDLILSGEYVESPGGEDPHTELLRRLVEVIAGSDEPLLMPLAESEGYLLLANGAYESAGRIRPVPPEYTSRVTGHQGESTVIHDIDVIMLEAAAMGKVLSECEVDWAVATQPFDVSSYSTFPQRWKE
jgi:hypothetical protein